LEASNSQATRAVTVIGLGLTFIDQIYYQSTQLGSEPNKYKARTKMEDDLLDKSKTHLLEGLNICRALGLSPYEAEALRGLALLEGKQDKWSESIVHIEAAIKIIESIRTNIADDKRIFYFSSVQDYYDLYIKGLMELYKLHPDKGYLQLAFQAADRSRARVLVEFLMQPQMNLDADTLSELNKQRRKIQQQIDQKSEEQLNLLSSKHTKEQMQTIENQLEKLIRAYDELQSNIRQSNPRYTQIMQPQPIKVETIQHLILDKETLLLQYHLGEDKSYVWTITSEDIRGFELPKRSKIEETAKQFYNILTTGNRLYFTEQNIKTALKRNRQVAAELSQMLLGPIGDQLNKRRLLIVADGALNFIPFAALPTPTNKSTNKTNLLITNHEIVNIPSVSTLLALNQDSRAPDNNLLSAPSRQFNGMEQNKITVFADPVFNEKDVRIRLNRRKQKFSNRYISNQVSQSSSVNKRLTQANIRSIQREKRSENIFPRLEYTRELAQQILAITPTGDVEIFLDFDASKEMAMGKDLSQSNIIIFATHGLVNNRYPELSGMMMSRIDKEGRQQNGFLQLKDVYKMRLNANLVILGACETAIGEEIKGEGVIGLTRGFMYAGAKGVMASLWKVEEMATVELIKRMYENIRKKGLNPSEALRAAQVSMQNEKRWEDPYYWSGFVLIGDWRQRVSK
jgi:CHAT domain-containing protein